MPGTVEHRSVTGMVNLIRKLLRGKDHVNALRFADCLAARTQPPPEIPGGPYHKTSKIYYFTRDARREVQPPTVIATSHQIASSGQVSTEVKPVTPGKVFECD
ncbi:NADH dehydrogenase [ubiquinone] 1 alpha subcomplex subunit 7 [Neodiprion pinetum]|uniref:NADH dehydrogenase [ubiquinone] 1 alpha subcomplex subunit 7 n=1 Tax=Neodiprion lecontei TaxID=441921 RepID=A0A6J0BZV2_NEOLC|nr:NADH dehydrogenase [ubiquinone] 1 alpha subcomplex subunit 7 [Neodiprion lecontei]XP_046417378.1 NADH dehydrogenase [ubiquinone] 1 alpha subcomplex subunit 7-like [Neodiprion fabricii]XP_046471964.1 NADH dehydrogenase [ubiquinone] 1 alpha subcomplex subunit 7-like [Neodiprion pinetum]XP_046610837.1 NADH dehydrogenase [ubiquinone] 1 alpha subcomplex subunit 7-like [Neodiprion virginianus]